MERGSGQGRKYTQKEKTDGFYLFFFFFFYRRRNSSRAFKNNNNKKSPSEMSWVSQRMEGVLDDEGEEPKNITRGKRGRKNNVK